YGDPLLKDQDLVIEKFVSGLSLPTTMSFVGDDLLVLEKNTGKVRLVRDGILQEKEILDLSVSNNSERGLLGITTENSTIYLYLTESTGDGKTPLGNRIYQYTWNGNELVNPILIKDLPATPGPNHDGGAMVTGLYGDVYAVIGDLNRNGVLQNYPSGEPDDTSVIIRIIPDDVYYAIGVRNSFGLAIDPVTGNLWDTENGQNDFDEINLVLQNFNSGWEKIMGPATEDDLSALPGFDAYVYSDPEFSWQEVVAPTALSFIDSDNLKAYQNSLFVGDCNYGNLYKFELNENRDGFVFTDSNLSDNVANANESLEEIVFGTGFGCITDMEIGPDGFLYIVSLSDGVIYKITPKTVTIMDKEIGFGEPPIVPIEYPIYGIVAALIIIGIIYLVKSKNKKS
ncbi:MAG TPA: PQQ-dependent sugar dehydrogenase, partial [Nitrosopumilaceae archaeon]|nr:PQQ-dependent sugar dehydrogenase [Nitrosopumilaceae archaeon]